MTTEMSLSARTRGAKLDPRYDSRLYRWLEAKMAIAGVPPQLDDNDVNYLDVRK